MAIKVIDLKSVGDELHHQFLRDEVAALEKIRTGNSDNLLKLEGVFRTKNHLYIVSEFCEGKDMGKILRKKQRLTYMRILFQGRIGAVCHETAFKWI